MRRFNPLLLRLLEEISLSLCLHSSQGSALDLDPPLHVGHLRVSVLLHSDRTGLKEQLLWVLWLIQASGEGGLRRRRGEPAQAVAGVTL